MKIDRDGKIWFTDIPEGRIGFFDPKTETSQIIELPEIIPVIQRNFPITLEVDSENNVWTSIANKNVLLKYDQKNNSFEQFPLLTKDSGPFAVLLGPTGKIWFTQQTVGQIGYLNPQTGEMKEFQASPPLQTPETMIFDNKGNIWIAEHQEGGSVTKFNPVLETFERISAPDSLAFPNSVSFDRFQNIWFAQHTVDKLAVYDPHNRNKMEVPIPTPESWVQFTVTDDKNNIWFVEQKPYKLGVLKTTEIPRVGAIPEEKPSPSLRYTEIASPLISMGIIATSLFFVKSIRDKRRINSLIGQED